MVNKVIILKKNYYYYYYYYYNNIRYGKTIFSNLVSFYNEERAIQFTSYTSNILHRVQK